MATDTEVLEEKTEVKTEEPKEGEKIYKIGEGWQTKGEETSKEEGKKEAEKKDEKPNPEDDKKSEKDDNKDDKNDEKKDEKPDFSTYLKDNFEIDSEDDLKKILSTNLQLTQDLEAEKKKVKEPVYKSERHKKIAEWLDSSGYDLDKINEGLETAATLVNLNVEKLDDRRALEEAYIVDNKDELSRDEAKKLFNKDFKK